MGDKAREVWESTWEPDVHKTEFALKRIRSARSAKLTPIKIDTDDSYGYFQGKYGKYETFLDFCPCRDFAVNGLPCKHIYRLAIELGLMDVAAESDESAILCPDSECASLEETIDIVESLSEDAQSELYYVAYGTRYKKTCTADFSDAIMELLDAGIAVKPPSEDVKIKFGTKGEIMDFLDSEGVEYRKSDKKAALEAICMEQMPDKTRKKFGTFPIVVPKAYSAQKIYYYLGRKLFDADGENLPYDEITEQLKKRGYCLRKGQ